MKNLISECKILTTKMNNMYMQYLDSIQMLHLDATSRCYIKYKNKYGLRNAEAVHFCPLSLWSCIKVKGIQAASPPCFIISSFKQPKLANRDGCFVWVILRFKIFWYEWICFLVNWYEWINCDYLAIAKSWTVTKDKR